MYKMSEHITGYVNLLWFLFLLFFELLNSLIHYNSSHLSISSTITATKQERELAVPLVVPALV